MFNTQLITAILSLLWSPLHVSIVRDILGMIPKYWDRVAASSSGNYHPQFALGFGGLVRHSVVVAYFCYRLALSNGLSKWQTDIVIAAGLLHDAFKQGLDGASNHTVHEHPEICANWLRQIALEYFSERPRQFILCMADVVETHMGAFTASKYSDVVHEVPTETMQKIVSDADMISATPELGFDFDRMVETIKKEVAKRG